MIPKSGRRFPACAKPSQLAGPSFKASAGEGRSGKIMRKQPAKAKHRINPKLFRFSGVRCLAIAAVAMPLIAAAAVAGENAGDCLGVGFEVQHPVPIAKIIADRPQVHFIKNASDDAACPAERESCLSPSYVVPGDLVLVGKTRGAFSCVSYQSAADRTQNWTVGWLPSASLTPVQPARAPQPRDWIGRWVHAGGAITISKGRRGTLRIRGEQVYPAAQNVHTGVISAEAKPMQGLVQFAEDGKASFDAANAEAGRCLVRMQRIAELLVVEDNGHCGGALVTFTGFYRRKG
jgi:hypothetical protein